MQEKRKHQSSFKAKVALEMIKQEKTQSQICSEYEINNTQARIWKDKLLKNIEKIFDEQGDKILEKKLEERDKLIEELYRQIGQLKVELDWLKKKLNVI